MNTSTADMRARYSLVTPEGIDLSLTLASRAARLGALLLDLTFMVAILLVFTVVIALSGYAVLSQSNYPVIIMVVWIVGAFLLRTFYFTILEAGPRAATLGKRIVGIRVASADGRPLTGYAIFVRNVLREIEVFIPLSFLLTLGNETGVDGWITVAGSIWSVAFLMVPFFAPNRMRAGDLIGGTIVIEVPKLALAADTAAAELEADVPRGPTFTAGQLDVYGQSELEVLEDILRHRQEHTVAAVAGQIRKKIGYRTDAGETDLVFLQAYYNAVRQHLEQRLLFGRRRRDKHDD